MTSGTQNLGRLLILAAAMMLGRPLAAQDQPTQPAPSPSPPPAPAPAPASGPDPLPPDRPQPPPGDPGAWTSEAEQDEFPETILTLTDGRRVSGFLVSQSPDKVVLDIGGVETPFVRGDIDRTEILPPVRQRYRELRRAIDDRDTDRRLLLVEWLRARRLYDEALSEVDGILAIEPSNRGATDARVLIEQQKMLSGRKKTSAGGPAKPAKIDKSATQANGAQTAKDAFPLLNEAQINLIRLYEVDLKDPPRIIVPRDTMTRLFDRYSGNELVPTSREGREAILRKRAADQVALIFKLRAREFYPEVRVMEDPTAMRNFREEVHRSWLVNSCATTQCHGGAEAGRLRLTTFRPSSDATVYTNFLILDRFRIHDPKSDKELPLIDYANPAKSPLLQMGLPADRSLFPHPAGPNTPAPRPIFQTEDDIRYRRAVEWISSMYQPHTDYPIEYTPPGAKKASEPAPPPGR